MNSELNLQFFLKTLKKYIIYILAITALCTGIAAVYTVTRTPVYSVSAELISLNIPIDEDGKDFKYTSSNVVEAQQALVNDYMEIVRSDRMLTAVRDDLKAQGYGDITVSRVRSMISTAQVDDSSVFTVTVSGSDIPEIKSIVTSVCNNAERIINEIQQRENSVEVLSSADEIHAAKIYPNPIANVFWGFTIGLFGSIFVFLIVAYYDRTVRSEEDLKKNFNIPVIGVIPTWDK